MGLEVTLQDEAGRGGGGGFKDKKACKLKKWMEEGGHNTK